MKFDILTQEGSNDGESTKDIYTRNSIKDYLKLHKVLPQSCHFDEGEIFARNSPKIGGLDCGISSVISPSSRNDKNVINVC